MHLNGNGKLPDDFIAPNQPTKCTWKKQQIQNPHINRSW